MRITWCLLGAFILVVVLISCTKEERNIDDAEESTPVVQKPDIVYSVNIQVMLQLVNKVRQEGCKCGATVMPAVPVLGWNDLLAKAAFSHSNDMKLNGYFSHTGTGNTSPGDRITAAGYHWRTYGENIAMGQQTEQIVMDSWMKSEGHCKNLMNKNFKELGVGRSGDYWTQVFAAK